MAAAAAAALSLPVLDAVAGVVGLQLRVAEGNPLPAQLIVATSAPVAMGARALVGVGFAVWLYRIGDRSTVAYPGMYDAVAAWRSPPAGTVVSGCCI